MEAQYELHFGEIDVIPYGSTNNLPIKETKHKLLITKEQKELLDSLANIEIDKDLNHLYVVNNLRFKCVPIIK